MINADINSASENHIVVTLSGKGVHNLTESEIERRMSNEVGSTIKAWFESGWQPWETAPIDGTYFDAWVEPNKKGREGFRAPHVHFDLDAFWTTETEYLYELGTPTHWRPEPEGPKK